MNPTEQGHILLSRARDYIELAGVYEIVCKPKGRVYIGQSKACARRSFEHLSMLKCGSHPNSAMQYDFDTLKNEDAFYFKVILPFDLPDDVALRKAEAKEIDRRRKYGVVLYNNMSVKQIDPNAQERPKPKKYEVAKEEQEQAPRVDYSNLPYRERPSYNPPILEGKCTECGLIGQEGHKLFFCDDRMLRCPDCVDQRINNLQAFLKSERERRVIGRLEERQTTSRLKMRWSMGANTAENDLTSAIVTYVRKYGQFPSEAHFHPECILPARKDIKIQVHRFTPIGYIDFPIPV